MCKKDFSDNGRQPDELPVSVRIPYKIFKKLIPVMPVTHLVLALAVISDENFAAYPDLVREMFFWTVYPGIYKFISVWYEKQVYGYNVRTVNHTDDVDKATEYICKRLYETGTAQDIRIRFAHYYRLFKETGLDAPEKFEQYAEEMFRYFRDNRVDVVKDGRGNICGLPDSSECPYAEGLINNSEAVGKAFEKTEEALEVIVSNAVYTYLFEYLTLISEGTAYKKTVYALIEGAAAEAAKVIRSKYAKAAEDDENNGSDGKGICGSMIYNYCFGARAGCAIQNRLFAIAAIVFAAKLYREKNNGKDTRTIEQIIRARCNIKKFHKEFIDTGMTVGELLEWTIVHLCETMDVIVPPRVKIFAEEKFRADNIYDAPIASVMRAEWNQKKLSSGCTEEEAHRDCITHFVVKLRKDILGKKDSAEKDNK